jgi:hypothetical protein
VDYDTWVATVPQEIARDSLWRMKAYRSGLEALLQDVLLP